MSGPTVSGKNVSNDMILLSLRAMAWERAKGELQSVLNTYWNADPKFERMDVLVEEFITAVDDGGFVEG